MGIILHSYCKNMKINCLTNALMDLFISINVCQSYFIVVR